MNIQEREHYEHEAGCASEFQNCFSEAEHKLAELTQRHNTMINEALEAGLFPVVVDEIYHCRATDAVAGSFLCLLECFSSEAEAEAYIRRVGYSEDNTRVLKGPGPAEAPVPALDRDDDDVPF